MNEFPNFHKRNSGSVSFPKFHKKEDSSKSEKEAIEYPLETIPTTDGNVWFCDFFEHIDLYNKGFYKEVLNLLLPKEGSGGLLTAVMTLSLGPVGYFAGRSIANEKNRLINFIIASSYFKLGEYQKANEHLNKILNWKWHRVAFLKAWTLYKLGYVEESKSFFKKAFVSKPSLVDLPCPVEVKLE